MKPQAQLLDIPHPYKGMLAFSTDIDETRIDSFLKVHGAFYGLDEHYGDQMEMELSNSFWVFSDYNDFNQFALCPHRIDAEPYPQAEAVAKLIRRGVIDSLHTFGNFWKVDFSRAWAQRALELFQRFNIQIPAWTYHGNPKNTQNIMNPSANWNADDPESETYHADLLPEFGIRFLCIPTIEAMPAKANVLSRKTLQDDQKFWGFKRIGRYRNHPDFEAIEREMAPRNIRYLKNAFVWRTKNDEQFTVMLFWNLCMLRFQISDLVLDDLVKNNAIAIMAQHLTISDCLDLYHPETIAALRNLNERQKKKDILVTSTSRALQYNLARRFVQYRKKNLGQRIWLDIQGVNDPLSGHRPADRDELHGLSFRFTDSKRPKVTVMGEDVDYISIKELPAEPNTWIATIPWENRAAKQREALLEFRDESRSLGLLTHP